MNGMKSVDQWLCWRYGKVRSNGKREKVPVNSLTGLIGDAHDPGIWSSYADAVVGELVHGCDGIGFVLTEDDPYLAIDIDGCIDPATGTIDEAAQAIVNSIETYWEVSPSYTGLRGLLKGTKPGSRSRTTAPNGTHVEVYDSRRFVTITGLKLDDCADVLVQQEALDGLYSWLFPERKGTAESDGAGYPGDDGELLSKARNTGQAYEFKALYDRADWSTLDFPSQSEVDFKLATMLAFWCGPDEERIDRLFRESELATTLDRKPDPEGYLKRTIEKAIELCPYFYSGKVTVTDEVQSFLSSAYQWLMTQAWGYRAGPTDRHVYRALLDHASQHGQEHEEGVTVSMGVRDLTLESGVSSRDTVKAALERLDSKHAAVRVLRRGKGRRATTYLLNESVRKVGHKEHSLVYGLGSGHRVRNPSPKGTYATIGKRNAQVLDILAAHTNTTVTLDELASRLQLSRQRKSDLKNKDLPMLKGLGLIEYRDGGYSVPDDIEVRLEAELVDSGCQEAYELQREKVAREQEAFRTRHKRKAENVDVNLTKVVSEIKEPSMQQIHCTYSRTCDCDKCQQDLNLPLLVGGCIHEPVPYDPSKGIYDEGGCWDCREETQKQIREKWAGYVEEEDRDLVEALG